MKRIFLLLALVPALALGQVQAIIGTTNIKRTSGTPASFSLSKLSVKYNDTFTYPSSFGWSDLGTPQANSRLIEGCTICTDSESAQTNYNTGLAYDLVGDRFISKNYVPKTNEFFTRAAIKTACASAVGTLPTIDLSVLGTGIQGIAHDPVNQIIFEYLGRTQIREYNYSGTLIRTLSTDLSASYDAGTLWYDYTSELMYFTGTGGVALPIQVMQRNTGNTAWETIETKWYYSFEGVGGVPGESLTVMNGNGGAIKWFTQNFYGADVRIMPVPISGIYQEGLVQDPRDYTLWVNDDSGGHGPIVNGNRLLHVDHPDGYYMKYHRYPNMFEWADFKLNGNTVTGSFYVDQVLTGNTWATGPPVDYGAHTGQQNLANWIIGNDDEAAELEFRGSNTAPTTTPFATKDYHTLVEYDPNATNDGWGSTIPSAWDTIPTNHRYMQVRVKPISPDPPWTPADLGADLLYWSEHNSIDGLYYDAADLDRVGVAIDYVNPLNNLFNSSASQKPLWNSAGSYLDMIAGNRHLQMPTGGVNLLKSLSECEVHAVARKNANTSRVVFLSASQLSSNNYQLRLQHNPSNVAPNNFLAIQFVDGSGNNNLYGITDTSISDWRMVTFALGGVTNKIYINNVEQTLTVNTGSNIGQCFDDIAAGMDAANVGRVRGTTSVAAVQHQRGIIITRPLNDTNRALLLDYYQRIGAVD